MGKHLATTSGEMPFLFQQLQFEGIVVAPWLEDFTSIEWNSDPVAKGILYVEIGLVEDY